MSTSYQHCELNIVPFRGRNAIDLKPAYTRFLQMLLKNGAHTALDLCCGYGQYAVDMANHGLDVTAVDIDKHQIEDLRGDGSLSQLHFVAADMKCTGLPDAAFDAVICLSALHHQTAGDLQKTVGEIQRLLRPGGLLLADVLSRDDESYGLGDAIEPHTFVGSRPGEEQIPHHYVDEAELATLFRGYESVQWVPREYHLALKGTRLCSRMYDIIAKKASSSR